MAKNALCKKPQQEMIFEGMQVEIIEINGEPYFELYSTGMALGQVKEAKGRKYPRKDRIDENIQSAGIITVVHNGQQYINEEQLYDLMFEMKTDKVKPFRKWVTSEVLPSLRKTGSYSMKQNNQEQLTHVDKLVLKVYRGGSDAIIAHKELVQIEVAEETAKLKDGTNKILSAQQVVDMLGIRKLTTTLLHEWFVENGFGELIKFPHERNRVFQPSQRFFDYVAVKGYSFTGKTVKGNKIKVVYSTAMLDRLLDKHMASIVQFVQLRSKTA